MRKTFGVIALSMLIISPALAHQSEGDGDLNRGFMQMDRMMDRADEATESEARRRFLREHMNLMSDQMGMMHRMIGGHEDGRSASPRMGSESMQGRTDLLEDRMNMMQQMMEHLFAQQEMMMREEIR